MDVREKLVELLLREDGLCKLDECKDCEANGSCYYYRAADRIIAHGVTVQEWISVKDRLPENEKDVLIRAERKLYGIGKRGSKIVSVISMAFHTDGKMNTEQSAYTWETEYLDAEYDEEADAYIIPEGWWESVTYSEAFSAVCDVVTHWMPLPQPPKGE